jgi:hypothetical protein
MGKFLTVLLILIVVGMIFFNRAEILGLGKKAKDVVVLPAPVLPACNASNSSDSTCKVVLPVSNVTSPNGS